jgi:short subunit dehydrogenase-like uncharacterized protein
MSIQEKKLLNSNTRKTLPTFLMCLFVMLPLWLLLVLPLAIIWSVCNFMYKKIVPATKDNKAVTIKADVNYDASDKIPRTERKFDLILYGATGFTGGLAAQYLASNYNDSGLKWAIAGRKKTALEKVKATINCPDVPIVIADSSQLDTLKKMVNSTKCVITTVGPFMRYGSPLVEACANYGTDYCDITGETDFVRIMIDQFDDIARANGARIVHFTGHDCVPWDLSVMKLGEAMEAKGEKLVSVKVWDEVRGGVSGGTLETAFNALEKRVKVNSTLGFDPLMKQLNDVDEPATASVSNIKPMNQTTLTYRKDALGGKGSWVGNFFMAAVMANCVKRSNAVNNYSGANTRLKYYEAMIFPNFMAGFIHYMGLVWLATSFVLPPLKWLLRTFVLPKPGQGPSVRSMDAGFLNVTVEGKGDKGSAIVTTFYFPTDPGYRDTARMIVESGLSLVLSDEVSSVGGVFTPATCQKQVLIDRLCQTGSKFQIYGC